MEYLPKEDIQDFLAEGMKTAYEKAGLEVSFKKTTEASSQIFTLKLNPLHYFCVLHKVQNLLIQAGLICLTSPLRHEFLLKPKPPINLYSQATNL